MGVPNVDGGARMLDGSFLNFPKLNRDTPNLFGTTNLEPNYFLQQIGLGQNIFEPNSFPPSFFSNHFFYQNFFGDHYFLGQKFFGTKNFLKKILWTNIFSDQTF